MLNKIFDSLFFKKDENNQRKVSILGLVIIFSTIASIFFVLISAFEGAPILEKKIAEEKPEPNIYKDETLKSQESDMSSDLINQMEREIQIKKEQSDGNISPIEIEEIKEKYRALEKSRQISSANINLESRIQSLLLDTKQKVVEEKEKGDGDGLTRERYIPFNERIKKEDRDNSGGSSEGITFGVDSERLTNLDSEPGKKEGAFPFEQEGGVKTGREPFQNMLPLGTFIPVILDQDIISTDLEPTIWCTVATDVIFRRQLQLPLGIAKIRGRAAKEPVQNLLDITFDVILFSDGTELPIDGTAYSAFDLRYPDRFKVRGIPGKLITPPMYVTILNILLSSGLGAFSAYTENYINENTTSRRKYTVRPVVDPLTGNITNQVIEEEKPPVNDKIWESIALSAAREGVTETVSILRRELEKYKPYVKIEKGTPFFVQLNKTVDIDERSINGLAIAVAKSRQMEEAKGTKTPEQTFDSLFSQLTSIQRPPETGRSINIQLSEDPREQEKQKILEAIREKIQK